MNRDKQVLRELARRYAEIAADPVNVERRRLHTAVGDLRGKRPVVLLAEIPWSELAGEEELALQCEDPELRAAEQELRRTLYQWRHFPGDMIVPQAFLVEKVVRSTGIGITVDEDTIASDAHNPIVSHEYHDQLETEADFLKLHAPVITYREAETLARRDRLAEAFGDILPVGLRGHELHCVTWDDISRFKGVDNLLIALMDEPELMHRLVERLTGIYLDTVGQYEELGLFEAENQLSIHCTSALTSDLPRPDYSGKARAKDVWGRGAAQILATVSPAMHKEFDIDYMRRAMAPFGLVYYGCCEPLHQKIDIVEALPNLRKISVTPWADTEMACERIGKRYVAGIKANPAHVAVGKADEAVIRGELSALVSAARRFGCSCDIVLKDISTVCRNPRNLEVWERIAMELVQG